MNRMIMVLMVLMLVVGCGDQYKIGVIAPMTGNAAELGQHIQRGLDLANEQYGYELIYEDSNCFDTSAALSAANKFVAVDGIDLVVGPLCAPAYQAVSGLFNQDEVGFMHTSGVTPSFVSSAGRYGVAGLSTTIHDEDRFLADYIFNELGIRRMGVFVWNEEWALEHRAGFVKRFEELGGSIVFNEKFEIGDADFRTSILKMKEAGVEGVFVVALNFQNANIVRQLRELAPEIEIFGQFEIEDPAFLSGIEEAAEGVMYVYPKIEMSPEVSEFVERYRVKYGSEPNYYAYVGYDALKLYDWAISECGFDSECVMSKIKNAENFPGVSGLMTFESDGTVSREFVMKKIVGGKFVEV